MRSLKSDSKTEITPDETPQANEVEAEEAVQEVIQKTEVTKEAAPEKPTVEAPQKAPFLL